MTTSLSVGKRMESLKFATFPYIKSAEDFTRAERQREAVCGQVSGAQRTGNSLTFKLSWTDRNSFEMQ